MERLAAATMSVVVLGFWFGALALFKRRDLAV